MADQVLPRVSVIVVSFQARELLRRCLESIRAQQGIALEGWVVDNASTDGSADMVAGEFPEWNLVRCGENVGFSKANNLALARSGGDYLALVNPDTELPAGALLAVVEIFARWPRAGCVGLALRNVDGSSQPACHAHPNLLNLLIEACALGPPFRRLGIGTPTLAPPPAGGEGVVDWVSGAFMVLSRAAYGRVGGLDPESFMYGEEMDWSLRARHAGFETVFSDRAVVRHLGGGSGARGPLFALVIEARVRFLRRYHGRSWERVGAAIMTSSSAVRLACWRFMALLEGRHVKPRTREQIERHAAVLAWARRRSW